jgi:(p)ppGpp synthase/HD superfamily hydrolase
MITMKMQPGTLNDAIAIAAIAHKGQFDKAGDPYILQPLRMMMRMVDDDARIVAVLHDVVEDSSEEDKWDSERLRMTGFSEEVIEAVDCVTKRNGESYEDFVDRAASNPIAIRVKIADLEDNMNILRLDVVNERRLERIAKYHRSWKRLTSTDNV